MNTHTHTHTHTPLSIGDTDFTSSKLLKMVPVQDLAKQGPVGDWEAGMPGSSGRREKRGWNNHFQD